MCIVYIVMCCKPENYRQIVVMMAFLRGSTRGQVQSSSVPEGYGLRASKLSLSMRKSSFPSSVGGHQGRLLYEKRGKNILITA
jgi:hypothetical protein